MGCLRRITFYRKFTKFKTIKYIESQWPSKNLGGHYSYVFFREAVFLGGFLNYFWYDYELVAKLKYSAFL